MKHHFLAANFHRIARECGGILKKELEHLEINKYFYLVSCIGENNRKFNQTNLADIIGVDRSMMVRVINYLESKKYVNRVPNPTDKREYLIELTSLAQSRLPEIKETIEKIDSYCEQSLNKITPENFRSELESMQEKLIEIPKTGANSSSLRSSSS